MGLTLHHAPVCFKLHASILPSSVRQPQPPAPPSPTHHRRWRPGMTELARQVVGEVPGGLNSE